MEEVEDEHSLSLWPHRKLPSSSTRLVGAASGSKQDANTGAAMTAMKLMTQGGGGGGGGGGIGGALSGMIGGGNSGGFGPLQMIKMVRHLSTPVTLV